MIALASINWEGRTACGSTTYRNPTPGPGEVAVRVRAGRSTFATS